MSLLVRQKNIRAGGRWLLMSALLSVGTLFLYAQNNLAVPDALVVKARQNHGDAAATRVQAWQQLLIELQGVPEPEQLKRVNDFFNSTIPYVSDMKHWKKDDYWATPYESLATNGGDCEDYVIAKYHALRELGVETSKLRITYVNAVRINEAHMVLTYFPTKDAIPLVLDNLINIIAKADKRSDLVPVYSFNAEGMWLERMKGEGVRMGNPNKLDLWTELRVRMNTLGLNL